MIFKNEGTKQYGKYERIVLKEFDVVTDARGSANLSYTFDPNMIQSLYVYVSLVET